MGTPQFAVGTLQALLDEECEVVGVVTAPDRPAGRGRKLSQSAVKEFAVAKGLTVLQPTNLKASTFIDDLKSLNPELQIVVAFRMLPKVVWQLPRLGTINLHASLLPDYRGAAPINWVLMNGEEETGVTTFFIDDKIDTGAIILQEKLKINKGENAGGLHDRLMGIGAKLVVKTIELISQGNVETIIQPEGKSLNTAPKLDPETCKINWDQEGAKIQNHVKGLSPFPGAWTILTNGEETIKVKIYEGTSIKASHSLKPGTIKADKDSLWVAVKDGFFNIDSLQLAGKKRLSAKDVLNGLQFEKNSHMS